MDDALHRESLLSFVNRLATRDETSPSDSIERPARKVIRSAIYGDANWSVASALLAARGFIILRGSFWNRGEIISSEEHDIPRVNNVYTLVREVPVLRTIDRVG